ncbi:hypothetical protein [Ruegeria meonggei]|uniref:hypothetical protein n=1 Tax=Ruegeria meonggei TaxID=1446476 RepID=UPI0036708AB0
MNDSEELHAAIVSVIERHCESLPKGASGPIDSFASHVALAHRHRHQLVNKSDDVENLRELERALKKTAAIMEQLNDDTLFDLKNAAPELDAPRAHVETPARPGLDVERRWLKLLSKSGATANNDIIRQHKASLHSLLKGVKTLRRRPHYKATTSVKQDYEALAVAWACSKIWREHLNPGTVRRWDEVRKQVPKTLQRNRVNQPIFRFIQEMFEVFSIETLPSSALAALERAGGEEKLNLSLEVR